MDFRAPKILFISGVYMKDCVPIDDIFERQIIERLETPLTNYERLPSLFYGVDTWVKKTKIKCWYCDLHFDNMPIFIPLTIDRSKDGIGHVISVHGCFCSFFCAAAHNYITQQQVCSRKTAYDKIKFLHKLFTGKSVDDIPRPPDKYQMVQYGGEMSVAMFRRAIVNLRKLTLR